MRYSRTFDDFGLLAPTSGTHPGSISPALVVEQSFSSRLREFQEGIHIPVKSLTDGGRLPRWYAQESGRCDESTDRGVDSDVGSAAIVRCSICGVWWPMGAGCEKGSTES